MAEYRLHCFAQSGNTYKAALMLNLCGADWEPVFVDYFNGATRTSEYRDMNVMGEAPVLEHQGKQLTQSGVILEYLVSKLGKYGPDNEDERLEILRWILFDNHKLTSYNATLRFLVTLAKTGETEVTEFLRARGRAALDVLNDHLATRTFVVAERPTIADISLCGYLFWPDEFGADYDADYPHIRDWLNRIRQLLGWVHPYELMPGHPLPEK